MSRVALGARGRSSSAEPATDTAPPPSSATRLGPYELHEELGRGAMGAVFRAKDTVLGREVAVKVILSGQFASAAERKRFLAEAENAARLDHPAIVPILQSGETGGRAWFAMKRIDGTTLADRAATPLPGLGNVERLRWIAECLARIARAVQHAHERGILHRDLKPTNILVDAFGNPYVSDFGLSRALSSERSLSLAAGPVGTPAYMAPEVARGERSVNVASDVWSLGAILYELLTGNPPFPGGGLSQVLRDAAEKDPTPPDPASVPRELSAVALKCLSKPPADRYSSAGALAEDLERWLRGEPVLARPAGPIRRARLWARRKPTVAALVSACLLIVLLLAVGGPVVSFQLLRLRNREQVASAEARERLLESLVTQARGHRLSLEPGRRQAGLQAVRDAAAIRVTPELRDEAIGLLASIDLGRPRPVSPTLFRVDNATFDGDLHSVSVIRSNRAVALLNTADGRTLAEIPGPSTNWVPVWRHHSADGAWLTVNDGLDNLLVYDAADGRLVRRHSERTGGHISSDSRAYLVVPVAGGMAELRDLSTGAILHAFEAEDPGGAIAAFEPSTGAGRFAVAQGGRLRLHDSTGRKPPREFLLPHPVHSLNWAGSLLAAGLDSGTLWLLDPTSEKVQQFSIHRGPISFIQLDPDGRNALTWSYDGTSVGLDLRSGLPWMRGTRYRPVRFAADGNSVGLQGLQIALVAPVEGPDFRFSLPVVGRHEMHFSRDGRWLFSLGDGGFAVHSARTGRRLLLWEEDRCIGALPLAGGREIVLATPLKIVRWRFAESGGRLTLTDPRTLAETDSDRFEGPSLDAGEHSVLVPTLQNRLHRLPLDGTQGRSEIEGLVVPRSPSVSPDGRWLALGTFHGVGLDVRDLSSTSRPPARILAPGNGNARFSPDGRWLAWAGTSASKVFETGTWKEILSFPTERNGSLPGLAAWSSGGRMLAITRQGNEVVLLDSRDWSRLATLRIGFQPAVQTLTFSPDGRKLGLVHNADEAEIWDLLLLKARLRELGIDWNLPESPDATESIPQGLRSVLDPG